MTINATAAWLLALYVAVAEERGVSPASLQGTTQNDIIKEYLSRGTYIYPPAPSMRLITDMISYCYQSLPKWNPMNVCSYHLQEAGATPVEELSFALATACAVLDAVKDGAQVPDGDFPIIVGRISFFVNAGIRFVEEMCKMRAFVDLWDEICVERYAVTDERHRRFRYGVQVNSLGLTEQQPENNVPRILLEMLAVTLSKTCARPRCAASGMERGARPAAALGSAVVAAHAASARLRDRSSGIRRYLRRLAGDLGQGRDAQDGGARRAQAYRRDERRVAAVESGYLKAASRRIQCAARRRESNPAR